MERKVAVKKLGKMLGSSFGYRIDPDAPTSDEREKAKRQLPDLIAICDQAKKALEDRRQAILDADQQYRELLAAWTEARQRVARMQSTLHHFRFTVGVSNSMFFSVKAQGDSWEEVIDKLADRDSAR